MPYHISKYCSHISKALVYSQFVLALCGKNNNCKVVHLGRTTHPTPLQKGRLYALQQHHAPSLFAEGPAVRLAIWRI